MRFQEEISQDMLAYDVVGYLDKVKRGPILVTHYKDKLLAVLVDAGYLDRLLHAIKVVEEAQQGVEAALNVLYRIEGVVRRD